jgi:hypothetical protein
LVDKKRVVLELIDEIPDARLRALLELRYINNYKWATVADIMGYTLSWIEVKLRNQALSAFSDVFEKSKVKHTFNFS